MGEKEGRKVGMVSWMSFNTSILEREEGRKGGSNVEVGAVGFLGLWCAIRGSFHRPWLHMFYGMLILDLFWREYLGWGFDTWLRWYRI